MNGKQRQRLTVLLFGFIVLFAACSYEEPIESDWAPELVMVENPHTLTTEQSVREACQFLGQPVYQDGQQVTLRAGRVPKRYSVETTEFPVRMEEGLFNLKRISQIIPVHVINFDSPQGADAGYAITIADDRFTHKIVAYSEKGHVHLDTDSDAEFWKDRINGYLAKVVNTTRSTKNTRSTVYYHHYLWFAYNWHQQGEPYTDYTPLRNGERASAGCVAVSIGMIMAWHQWPLQGAYPRYETNTKGVVTQKQVFPSYEKATWALFHPHDSRGQVEAKDPRVRTHIADLLAEIGYKLNANYLSPTQTLAYSDNATAVFQHMGYHCLYHMDYYDSEKILDEIKQKRPVMMNGTRRLRKGESGDPRGHTFVITGVITEGRQTSGGQYEDLNKPLYIYLMNGNAGSGDGWYLDDMFKENVYNWLLGSDGRDEASPQVYPYRFRTSILTGIYPNTSNIGVKQNWTIIDDNRADYQNYKNVYPY